MKYQIKNHYILKKGIDPKQTSSSPAVLCFYLYQNITQKEERNKLTSKVLFQINISIEIQTPQSYMLPVVNLLTFLLILQQHLILLLCRSSRLDTYKENTTEKQSGTCHQAGTIAHNKASMLGNMY